MHIGISAFDTFRIVKQETESISEDIRTIKNDIAP